MEASPLREEPQPRQLRRISVRIWLGACFAGVGIITAASVYFFVTDSSNRVISERSTELAVGRTVRDADLAGTGGPSEVSEALQRNLSETYSAWAFNVKGRLVSVGGGSEATLADIDEREVAVAQALNGGRYIAELPNSTTIVAVPIFRRGKVDGALLTHSIRPKSLQRSFDRLQGGSIRALAIAVGIGLLAGALIAGLIAARMKRLAVAAGELAAGRFETPLEGGWRDEIGDLSRALDAMRAALRESFAVLTSERDRLSTIFAGLGEAVLVVDTDGTVRFSNPAAKPLLTEAGTPIEPLMPLLRRAAERGHAEHDSLRVGERVYALEARDMPVERAVLAVVRDRTQELRRDQAEREFISNAAHELRNPIAGISSAIEVLRDGAKDDPEARDHFLDRLSDDAERMTRLTQALLALARAESVEGSETEVADVRVAAADAAEAIPRPEGVELQLEVEPDLAVQGDPVLLRQVLIGLLANAYKHTPPPGTVTLRGHRAENEVLVEVTDTGTGIPREERSRVFERFYRGSGMLDKEGFGLGLAIAKRMVDVMGGEIGVDSAEGQGSTFWVRLEAAKPTPTPVA